uniref:Uncharacterized protein n=1 Tax=Anguilla anguilla TaxID=7936 RepID=A0A0E9XX18_ANGAN
MRFQGKALFTHRVAHSVALLRLLASPTVYKKMPLAKKHNPTHTISTLMDRLRCVLFVTSASS